MDIHRLMLNAFAWLQEFTSGQSTLFLIPLAILSALIVAWPFFRKRPDKLQVRQAVEQPSVEPVSQKQSVENVLAQDGGIGIGISIGSSVKVYNISVPDSIINVHAGKLGLPLEQAARITRGFLTDIENYYRYLPLRGMGDNSGLRLKFPLVELFIPLNARLTMPRGDTLSDELRLAGRRLTEEEKIQIGGRVDEARPVLKLITEYPVLVILGDPGSGKSSIVRFLAYCWQRVRAVRWKWPIICPCCCRWRPIPKICKLNRD